MDPEGVDHFTGVTEFHRVDSRFRAVVLVNDHPTGRRHDIREIAQVDQVASAEYRDIFFLDAQNGWMVGGVGVSVPGGIVAHTRDG